MIWSNIHALCPQLEVVSLCESTTSGVQQLLRLEKLHTLHIHRYDHDIDFTTETYRCPLTTLSLRSVVDYMQELLCFVGRVTNLTSLSIDGSEVTQQSVLDEDAWARIWPLFGSLRTLQLNQYMYAAVFFAIANDVCIAPALQNLEICCLRLLTIAQTNLLHDLLSSRGSLFVRMECRYTLPESVKQRETADSECLDALHTLRSTFPHQFTLVLPSNTTSVEDAWIENINFARESRRKVITCCQINLNPKFNIYPSEVVGMTQRQVLACGENTQYYIQKFLYYKDVRVTNHELVMGKRLNDEDADDWFRTDVEF